MSLVIKNKLSQDEFSALFFNAGLDKYSVATVDLFTRCLPNFSIELVCSDSSYEINMHTKLCGVGRITTSTIYHIDSVSERKLPVSGSVLLDILPPEEEVTTLILSGFYSYKVGDITLGKLDVILFDYIAFIIEYVTRIFKLPSTLQEV